MGRYDLAEYVLSEAMDNPIIDMDKLQTDDYGARIEWLHSQGKETQYRGYLDESDFDPVDTIKSYSLDDTLQSELKLQLSCCSLSEAEKQIGNYFIGCVDSHGFLDEDICCTARRFNSDVGTVEKILRVLRSFTPLGICSKNIKEYLLMQIQDADNRQFLYEIIKDYLEDIAQGHYALVAKKMKTSTESVRDACIKIRGLSPFPAAGFRTRDTAGYVFPDVQIAINAGLPEVSLFRPFSHRLMLNEYYVGLYTQSEDEMLKAYLSQKAKCAQQLIKNVEQRESTMLQCAKIIADVQKDYFAGNVLTLAPLSMEFIADSLGVNISTISRAVSGKYIQCARGVFPMNFFLSKEISKSVSRSEVKTEILALIKSENKCAPLSDQQICNHFKKRNKNVQTRYCKI